MGTPVAHVHGGERGLPRMAAPGNHRVRRRARGLAHRSAARRRRALHRLKYSAGPQRCRRALYRGDAGAYVVTRKNGLWQEAGPGGGGPVMDARAGWAGNRLAYALRSAAWPNEGRCSAPSRRSRRRAVSCFPECCSRVTWRFERSGQAVFRRALAAAASGARGRSAVEPRIGDQRRGVVRA